MHYSKYRQTVIDRVVCILRIVTILLLFAVMFFGRQNKWLAAAVIADSVTMLLLWISQYQYFHEEKMGLFAWQNYSANETDAIFCVMIPPMILSIRAMRDFWMRDWAILVTIALAAAVLVGAVLLLVTQPKEMKIWQYACIFLVLFACMLGICTELNYILDFSEPETQYCKVVDRGANRGSTRHSNVTNYYLIVTSESGEELIIPVSYSQCQNIMQNSVIPVKVSRGALGIGYAYLEHQLFSTWT